MNFLSLRRTENAQQEIRNYTPELEELFRQEMPVTYEAWRENGFVAP
jgi:thymidylate synthase ThyX